MADTELKDNAYTHVGATGEWKPEESDFYCETEPFRPIETGEWPPKEPIEDIPADSPQETVETVEIVEEKPDVVKSNPALMICLIVMATFIIIALIMSPAAILILIVLIPLLLGAVVLFSSISTVSAAVGEVAYTVNRVTDAVDTARDAVETGNEYTADDGSEPTLTEKITYGEMGRDFDDFYCWYRSLHENDELDFDDPKDKQLLEIFTEMDIPWPEEAARAFKQGRLRIEI